MLMALQRSAGAISKIASDSGRALCTKCRGSLSDRDRLLCPARERLAGGASDPGATKESA